MEITPVCMCACICTHYKSQRCRNNALMRCVYSVIFIIVISYLEKTTLLQ